MTWSRSAERAYWAGEIPLVWRRGWWMVLFVVLFAVLGSIPGCSTLAGIGAAVIAAIVVVRRVRAGRDLSGLLHQRWPRSMGAWMLSLWPGLARTLRLEVRQPNEVPLLAGAGVPVWSGWTCLIPVALPPGLAREDLVAASGRIAQAFHAVRVSVVGEQLSALGLQVDYIDGLGEPFSFPRGGTWNGSTALMGIAEGGSE